MLHGTFKLLLPNVSFDRPLIKYRSIYLRTSKHLVIYNIRNIIVILLLVYQCSVIKSILKIFQYFYIRIQTYTIFSREWGVSKTEINAVCHNVFPINLSKIDFEVFFIELGRTHMVRLFWNEHFKFQINYQIIIVNK